MNNPISLADWNGKEPGDAFASISDALFDFATLYNPVSWNLGLEAGSSIYQYDDGLGSTMYTYGIPVLMYSTSTNCLLSWSPIDGGELVATVHTHPYLEGETEDESHFSDRDISSANKEGVNSYISIYTGEMREYNPHSPKSIKTVFSNLPAMFNVPLRDVSVNKGNTFSIFDRPLYGYVDANVLSDGNGNFGTGMLMMDMNTREYKSFDYFINNFNFSF